MFQMKYLTSTIGWLTTLATTVLLVASMAGADMREEAVPSPAPVPFSEQYSPSGEALELEQLLEARGFTCTEASVLTDRIIVDTQQGASVVTFDQAWRLSKSGSWIRSYCVK